MTTGADGVGPVLRHRLPHRELFPGGGVFERGHVRRRRRRRIAEDVLEHPFTAKYR